MGYTIPALIGMIRGQLFKPDFFTRYNVKHLGVEVQIVKPIVQWTNGEVQPGYQVSTRGNGVDKARWPQDLGVEVVS